MGPKNIIAGSRISNDRICLYLSSEAIADNFIEEYNGITIQDTFFKAKKLAMPSQKLILSNVHPCTPDTLIVQKLILQGTKIHSAIFHLHVHLSKEVFGERNCNLVLSFR